MVLSSVSAIPLNFEEDIKLSLNEISSNKSDDHPGSGINIHITELNGDRTVVIDSDNDANTTTKEKNLPTSQVTLNQYQNLINKSVLIFQHKLDEISSKIDLMEMRMKRNFKNLLINEHLNLNNSEIQKLLVNQVKKILLKLPNELSQNRYQYSDKNLFKNPVNDFDVINGGQSKNEDTLSLRAKRKSENQSITQFKKPRILSLYANFMPESSSSSDHLSGGTLRRTKRTRRDIPTAVKNDIKHDSRMTELLVASPEYQRLLRTWLASKHHHQEKDDDNNPTDIKLLYHVTSKPLTSESQHKDDKDYSNLVTRNLYDSDVSSNIPMDMDFDHFYDSLPDDNTYTDATDVSSEFISSQENHKTTTESIYDILWS